MLVPSKVTWWRLVFKYRGSELPKITGRIAAVTAVSIVVTVLEAEHDWHPNLKPLPFQLIGVALGIFLGFRNNASYDRWWEGRKLWGKALNDCRTLARQILTLIGPPPGQPGDAQELAALHRELVYRVIAWAHALRLSLRHQGDISELAKFLPESEVQSLFAESNKPYAILQGTAERVRDAWRRGWIDSSHMRTFEATFTSLTDTQGGAERLNSTPIPFSYTTLIHRITAVYCFALPFGVVDEVGKFTPFVCAMIAYAFFGLDVVGDEIEMPFGTDTNDLPLNAITRTIEVNLRQRLGETDLPPMARPVDEILD